MTLKTELSVGKLLISAANYFADIKDREEIEKVFSDFLANFHTVYYLNGQHTITFTSETTTDAIGYCAVKLVGEQDGKWLISKRIANFMISESREIATQH